MNFDLKNFRLQKGYKSQIAFAEKIKYNQPTLSLMEKGSKPISDSVLMKIEEAFEVNLDLYKKKERNKLGRYLPDEQVNSEQLRLEGQQEKIEEIEELISQIHPTKSAELRRKYVGLIAKRLDADVHFWNEGEEAVTLEDLAKENNMLLKELVTGVRELITIVKKH